MPAPPAREFEFAEGTYRAVRLSAWGQWEALQALKPALEEAQTQTRGRPRAAADDLTTAFADAVREIAPEALTVLFDLALVGVERRDADGWLPVWDATVGVPLFADLGAGRVVLLVVRILGDNLHGYFSYKPVAFDRTDPGPAYNPVVLPNGLSWFFAPVDHRYCLYSELMDGTLDLRDIARMNDLIAISAENRTRARKAAEEEAARNNP